MLVRIVEARRAEGNAETDGKIDTWLGIHKYTKSQIQKNPNTQITNTKIQKITNTQIVEANRAEGNSETDGKMLVYMAWNTQIQKKHKYTKTQINKYTST